MNRFSFKQCYLSNANEYPFVNPFRIKRTYNTMLEQDHMSPSTTYINTKRFKQNEGKATESLIRMNRPKISEKLKREIELYNYQRRGYTNIKILPCNCDN